MSKPTQSIFPIENGRLTTNLDCNNLQLVNLDESNLSGGGGGGGSGNDTGTTTAILKGDGNHGFADAIAGTDYATSGAVAVKEDTATHDADILTLTTAVDLTEADIATLTTAVGTKASTAALTAGLALKADDSALQAYITSNDADVALKAYTADITTALGNKADSASVSTALAGKEPLLPTTANDRYILARRNASGTDVWYFVDPVTLGTTSQTFADGQSFTNTNYDSATAAFVSGDVGKTIVSAGVIPDGTTIVSRTSATRVVLSAPTLSTATLETFTIINRLLTSNTGTVTSFSFTNNVTNLLDSLTSGVSNSTSSPTLTLNPATAGANTFFGNFTGFASTPGFGSASAARASLGGTTAGQALFQVTNPGAVSFPQFTSLNAAVTRTPSQVLGDIGGESALTFSTPLTRSVSPPNVIGIQAAGIGLGSGQSGYLTGSDWVAFNGKLSGNRTLTTTAPIRIDGGPSANLTADRTLSMAASSGNADGTVPVDGYLKGTDFITFLNRVPNSRTVSVGSGTPLSVTNLGQLNSNITISIAKATSTADGYLAQGDFNAFANQVPVIRQAGAGGTLTLADVSPPITRVILNTLLTSPLTINLPQSVGYGNSIGFPFIEIVDIVAGGAQKDFGITVNRTAGANNDLIDGNTFLILPRGMGYVRINSNGLNRWSTVKYFVDSLKDPNDPTKQVRVNFPTLFPTNTSLLFSPAYAGNSVSVVPGSVNLGEVMAGVNSDGSIAAKQLTTGEIVPVEATVLGTADSTIANDGTITSVKLSTGMNGLHTYTFPNATLYTSGEIVRFYDVTGTVSLTSYVRLQASTNPAIPATASNFNGLATYTITTPNFNRLFIADPANNNWNVAAGEGATRDTWHTVTAASQTDITCNPNVIENLHIVNMSSAITLTFPGVSNGQCGLLKLRDSTGNHVVTVPNAFGKTPTASGTGTFTTSTGSNVEDLYKWTFDGNYYTFTPLGVNLIGASPVAASNIADDTTMLAGNPLSTDGSVNVGANATNMFIAARVVADGAVTNGTSYIIGKVSAILTKAGTGPGTTLTLSCMTDSGTNSPSGVEIGTPGTFAVSGVTTAEQVVDFTTNFTLTGARTVTNIATTVNNINFSCSGGQLLQSDVGAKLVGANFPASARIATIALDGNSGTLVSGTGTLLGTANAKVQHIYWLVMTGNPTSFTGTNFMSWHFHTSANDTGGRWWRKNNSGGAWTIGGVTPGTSQIKYITYK